MFGWQVLQRLHRCSRSSCSQTNSSRKSVGRRVGSDSFKTSQACAESNDHHGVCAAFLSLRLSPILNKNLRVQINQFKFSDAWTCSFFNRGSICSCDVGLIADLNELQVNTTACYAKLTSCNNHLLFPNNWNIRPQSEALMQTQLVAGVGRGGEIASRFYHNLQLAGVSSWLDLTAIPPQWMKQVSIFNMNNFLCALLEVLGVV